MEYYALVKHIHMSAAGLSLIGFLLRGYWMLTNSVLLQTKPSKILPHIIDTVLLVAAIVLLVLSELNPFVVNWITAKIILLVAYVILGTIALKRGKTKKIKVIAFVASLASVLAIFAIASIKPALSF
ncbi:SirB2 family protein [Aliikangiella sp. IMCC44359]|uniref:SirB2 family protein n=1 Tax=Aliikangiella sp. IMCC44359 TaxID=3459125 RepID=UPI00403B3160